MGKLAQEQVGKFLDVYDALALTIHSNNGEITSRTTIQKLIYFLNVKIPTIQICSYKHHFYGPYNSEVASALEDMAAFSYLDEKTLPAGFYNSYHYSLTNSGKNYAAQIKENYKEEYDKIIKIVEICKNFCELKPKPLSFAAKAHYIMTNTDYGKNYVYTAKDVREVAKNFDWELTDDDILIGVKLLEKLELVRIS